MFCTNIKYRKLISLALKDKNHLSRHKLIVDCFLSGVSLSLKDKNHLSPHKLLLDCFSSGVSLGEV